VCAHVCVCGRGDVAHPCARARACACVGVLHVVGRWACYRAVPVLLCPLRGGRRVYVSPGLSPAAMDLLWGVPASGAAHTVPEAAALRATKVRLVGVCTHVCLTSGVCAVGMAQKFAWSRLHSRLARGLSQGGPA
jgi:hypothetical protein